MFNLFKKKKKLVFCLDCLNYNGTAVNKKISNRCKIREEIIQTPISRTINPIYSEQSCDELNKNNDCKRYEGQPPRYF